MQLTVNGKSHEVSVEEDMPLLWVLRDVLDITGPKYGCGIARCGACTVHIAGDAVRSCQLAVGDVEGEITTIENVGAGALHPVQTAWITHQVAQCSYCQAGQIMQAVDLLQRNTDPTDADLDAAMSGNLCRCGSYPRIRADIKSAATAMRGAWGMGRIKTIGRRSFLIGSAAVLGVWPSAPMPLRANCRTRCSKGLALIRQR